MYLIHKIINKLTNIDLIHKIIKKLTNNYTSFDKQYSTHVSSRDDKNVCQNVYAKETHRQAHIIVWRRYISNTVGHTGILVSEHPNISSYINIVIPCLSFFGHSTC